MIKQAWIGTGVLGWWLLQPGMALACSCDPASASELFASDRVIAVRIDKLSSRRTPGGKISSPVLLDVRATVMEVFSGSDTVGAALELVTTDIGVSCGLGIRLQPQMSWMMFLRDGQIRINACDRHLLLTGSAGETYAALKAAVAEEEKSP
jgi:hypothetical protein